MRQGFIISLLFTLSNASWMFGPCAWWGRDTKDYDMPELDTYKFQGTWFELMKDVDDAFWSGATCVVDDYTAYGDNDLQLERKYNVLWVIPWGYIFPKTISQSAMDGKRYIAQIPIIRQNQHDIVSTDYENYAVTYGCTDRFWFLWHEQFATLLSRTKHLEEPYVKEAKHALKRLNYDYNAWWGWQWNAACDLTYEDTKDIVFIELLNSQPNWGKYSTRSYYNNNDRFRSLYDGSSGKYPYGYLPEGIFFHDVNFSTPTKGQIEEAFYQEYIILENVVVHHEHELNPAQYDPEQTYGALADVWLLAEGLSDAEINELKWVQSQNKGENICCLEYSTTMMNDDKVVDLEWLINGNARIIYHGFRGVQKLMEGHFNHGRMDQFGRFMTIVKGDFEYSYFGWIPDSQFHGKGIAVIDQNFVFSGQYAQTNYFTDSDRYLDKPSPSYTIKEFDSRDRTNSEE